MAPTPTTRLCLLVNELIRLRMASGVTPAQAAKHLGCRVTKISRIENKQSNVTAGDTKMLAELYGASPEHVEVLLDLARGQRQRGRWESYRATYHEWFRTYVDLEQDAATIQQVQSEILPGLLQAEGYIRAMHAATNVAPYRSVTDVENSIVALRERQAVLTRDEPVKASFVLSESCLRRVVGGRAVMRDQLAHLIELAALPNVQIQILPFEPRTQITHITFNFTLLNIPAPGILAPLNFVYIEQFDDGRELDDKDAVANYVNLWNLLTAAALSPGESIDFLLSMAV